MKAKLVADPRTIWSYWTVKLNAYLTVVYMAAGAGWLALNEQQRVDLMTWLGVTPESQPIVVTLMLFTGAFFSSLTIGLRAIKQAEEGAEKAEQEKRDADA